jgi:glycosyltransferase involved in cell wall biosynthesis/sulfatase maturation enzyme AslB (radical SAM superfamily)
MGKRDMRVTLGHTRGRSSVAKTHRRPLITVIIPAHNSEQYIGACLDSVSKHKTGTSNYEIIVIDDASQDNTRAIVEEYRNKWTNLKLITIAGPMGPGIARNAGIVAAEGEWIVFVDSDDQLAANALADLESVICANNDNSTDVISYNWTQPNEDTALHSSLRSGRRDTAFLFPRERRISAYLRHWMDGSVIYTAIKRSLIIERGIAFRRGIHEDVDFIFKVYFSCKELHYYDRCVYIKRRHKQSITNGISTAHINGYFDAWKEIGEWLQLQTACHEGDSHLWPMYLRGYLGTVATRVREVVRHEDRLDSVLELFQLIKSRIDRDAPSLYQTTRGSTSYERIATKFMTAMSNSQLTDQQKASEVIDFTNSLEGKSWSCTDLHHSVFIRSGEIRTCCKRFFVGGEMRGDVKLFEVSPFESVSHEKILSAKRELHQNINAGISTACDGCPFLELKDWGPLNTLDIRYLSLEYHSVCTLKCTYCSDEYYGGKNANFDVKATIHDLIANGCLANCTLVVWGGGEPVVGKDFVPILREIQRDIPQAQQRVLTNSVKFSQEVADLLAVSKGQVITSIDAGTPETFRAIRGRDRLSEVYETLRQYSHTNADRVTIKYIFTEGNSSENEVEQFVKTTAKHDLMACNFQISGDFKSESFPDDTARNMILMFGLLRKYGAGVVYFDELLRHRLCSFIDPRDKDVVREWHQKVGCDFIATSAKYPELTIWGAGQLSKYLMKHAKLLTSTKVVRFVDSTPAKIGTLHSGVKVESPRNLMHSDEPILIAAVQGYPLILEELRAFNISECRIVRDLVV